MVRLLYMSGYSWDEMTAQGLVTPNRPFFRSPLAPTRLSGLVCQELESGSPVVGR